MVKIEHIFIKFFSQLKLGLLWVPLIQIWIWSKGWGLEWPGLRLRGPLLQLIVGFKS
jgi:hypothetical protein